LEKVNIDTEKNILLGRDEDRTKISMSGVPLKNTNN
jgi:NADH-quinone oxidoreductase subunit G